MDINQISFCEHVIISRYQTRNAVISMCRNYYYSALVYIWY